MSLSRPRVIVFMDSRGANMSHFIERELARQGLNCEVTVEYYRGATLLQIVYKAIDYLNARPLVVTSGNARAKYNLIYLWGGIIHSEIEQQGGSSLQRL